MIRDGPAYGQAKKKTQFCPEDQIDWLAEIESQVDKLERCGAVRAAGCTDSSFSGSGGVCFAAVTAACSECVCGAAPGGDRGMRPGGKTSAGNRGRKSGRGMLGAAFCTADAK